MSFYILGPFESKIDSFSVSKIDSLNFKTAYLFLMLYLRNYQKYWYPILRVQLTPIFEHVWLLGPIMSKIDS